MLSHWVEIHAALSISVVQTWIFICCYDQHAMSAVNDYCVRAMSCFFMVCFERDFVRVGTGLRPPIGLKGTDQDFSRVIRTPVAASLCHGVKDGIKTVGS